MKNKKKITTINVDEWILEHIQNNTRYNSISEAFMESYKKQNLDDDMLQKQIEDARELIDKNQRILKQRKDSERQECLDMDSIKWLISNIPELIKKGVEEKYMLMRFKNECSEDKMEKKSFNIWIRRIKKEPDKWLKIAEEKENGEHKEEEVQEMQ